MKKALLLLLSVLCALSFVSCGNIPVKGDITSDTTSAKAESNKDESTAVTDSSVAPENADKLTTECTKLFAIEAIDEYRTVQGGCTDGKYLYQSLENHNLANHESYINKYDLSTNKLVKTSKSIQLDHSNDLTYNSKTNQIVVVHNAPNRTKISFLDADTLEYISTKTISFSIFSLGYNATTDRYVIGISGGQDFAILDSEFNLVKQYQANNTGYTTQGLECNDKFIYFVQYNENVIMIYDWDGNFISQVELNIDASNEPENISLIGDVFYVGCNNEISIGGDVYKVIIKEVSK